MLNWPFYLHRCNIHVWKIYAHYISPNYLNSTLNTFPNNMLLLMKFWLKDKIKKSISIHKSCNHIPVKLLKCFCVLFWYWSKCLLWVISSLMILIVQITKLLHILVVMKLIVKLKLLENIFLYYAIKVAVLL